jgi:hypothetical protein
VLKMVLCCAVDAVRKSTGYLLDSSQEPGLEVGAEKQEYVLDNCRECRAKL